MVPEVLLAHTMVPEVPLAIIEDHGSWGTPSPLLKTMVPEVLLAHTMVPEVPLAIIEDHGSWGTPSPLLKTMVPEVLLAHTMVPEVPLAHTMVPEVPLAHTPATSCCYVLAPCKGHHIHYGHTDSHTHNHTHKGRTLWLFMCMMVVTPTGVCTTPGDIRLRGGSSNGTVEVCYENTVCVVITPGMIETLQWSVDSSVTMVRRGQWYWPHPSIPHPHFWNCRSF